MSRSAPPPPPPVSRSGEPSRPAARPSDDSEPPAALPERAFDGFDAFDAFDEFERQEADAAGAHSVTAPSRPAPMTTSSVEELAGEPTAVESGMDDLIDESTLVFGGGASRQPTLVVERGKDLGREHVLVEGDTTVGRGVDNEVILTDPRVSRSHVRIVRRARSLWLVDLGSGNGTRIGGREVRTAALRDGDRIELGETVLRVALPPRPDDELEPEDTSTIPPGQRPPPSLGARGEASVVIDDAFLSAPRPPRPAPLPREMRPRASPAPGPPPRFSPPPLQKKRASPSAQRVSIALLVLSGLCAVLFGVLAALLAWSAF